LGLNEKQKQDMSFKVAEKAQDQAMALYRESQTQKRHAQDLAARKEIAMMKDKEKSEMEKVIASLQATHPNMHYHEAYELANQYKFPASKINAQTQQDRLQLNKLRLMQSNDDYKEAFRVATDPNSKTADVQRAEQVMKNIEERFDKGSSAAKTQTSTPSAPTSQVVRNWNDITNVPSVP